MAQVLDIDSSSDAASAAQAEATASSSHGKRKAREPIVISDDVDSNSSSESDLPDISSSMVCTQSIPCLPTRGIARVVANNQDTQIKRATAKGCSPRPDFNKASLDAVMGKGKQRAALVRRRDEDARHSSPGEHAKGCHPSRGRVTSQAPAKKQRAGSAGEPSRPGTHPSRRRKAQGEKVFSRTAPNPRAFEDLTDDSDDASRAVESRPPHERLNRVDVVLKHIATGRATPHWIHTGLEEAAGLLASAENLPIAASHASEWPKKRRDDLRMTLLSQMVLQDTKAPVLDVRWDKVKVEFGSLLAQWENLAEANKTTTFLARIAPALRSIYLGFQGLEKVRGSEDQDVKKHWEWYQEVLRGCGAGDFHVHLLDGRVEEMSRMYDRLISIQDCIDSLHLTFRSYVAQTIGKSITELLSSLPERTPPTPQQYFNCLRSAHRLPLRFLKHSFQNARGFENAFGKAMREMINKNAATEQKWGDVKATNPAFYLAKRFDTLLKSPDKGGEEPEEGELDDLVMFFNYTEEKDIFSSMAIKTLARRLLHGSSADADREAYVVRQFTTTCGTEYTSRMVKMTNDLQISKDLDASFKARFSSESTEPDAEFLVLSTAFWPIPTETSNLFMPVSLEPLRNRFTQFYDTKYTGRKLRWAWSMSRLELRTNYASAPYIFVMTFIQGALLLQFNENVSLELGDLVKGTGLDADDAKDILDRFVKQRVLTLSPPNVYKLNLGFKYKQMRVPLMGGIKSTKAPSPDEVRGEVVQQRRGLIQAAIVRIMKAHKQLKHTQLVQETVSELAKQFKPDIRELKAQIDSLIDKGYLSRAENERDLYHYEA